MTGTWYPPAAGTGGFLSTLANPPFAPMTTTNPRVIGLWSPTPGCGKSTVAELIEELEPASTIMPFAETLKLMLEVLIRNAGYSERQAERALYDPEGKTERLYFLPGMPTGRELMQTLGTEWGRFRIHQDLWTTVWRAQVRSCAVMVIADDVRFPNEAQAVRDVGGELWCIQSPLGKPAGDHISEGQLGDEPFDVIINNNGTLEQLRTAVQHALNS